MSGGRNGGSSMSADLVLRFVLPFSFSERANSGGVVFSDVSRVFDLAKLSG